MTPNRQFIICGSISLLLLALIWGNSLQPAAASDALSTGVLAQLQQLWYNITASPFPLSNHILRKLGHFSEFLLFGLFATLTATARHHKKNLVIPVVLYMGLMVAVLDETIQHFSPGRGPQVTDVLIDHSGFCCGLLLALLISKWLTAMYQGLSK
ncbi:MAG: VanZ family protein [Peptococcaceae bacterium]